MTAVNAVEKMNAEVKVSARLYHYRPDVELNDGFIERFVGVVNTLPSADTCMLWH